MAVGEETATPLVDLSGRRISETVFIEGIHVNEPLSRGRLIAIGALGFGLLSLVAVPITVSRVESTLTASAEEELAALGVPTDWIDVEFDFRDGRISGDLPYHVSPDMVVNRVDHPLLASLTVSAEAGPGGGPEQQTSPLELNASFNGERVTVVGMVLSEADYDAILGAVAEAAPGSELDDRLEVSGLEPAVEGAEDRIDDLITALGQLGPASQWLIQLTDNSLRIDVGVETQRIADEMRPTLDALGAVPTRVEVTVFDKFQTSGPKPVSNAQVEALQAELDELSDEMAESVQFPPWSFGLSPEAEVTLDKVVAALLASPDPVLDITGHTDTSGDLETNKALSQRRANAVRAYLASNGIDVQRLRSRGLGSSEPLETNETEVGRAANRRIELQALRSFD